MSARKTDDGFKGIQSGVVPRLVALDMMGLKKYIQTFRRQEKRKNREFRWRFHFLENVKQLVQNLLSVLGLQWLNPSNTVFTVYSFVDLLKWN